MTLPQSARKMTLPYLSPSGLQWMSSHPRYSAGGISFANPWSPSTCMPQPRGPGGLFHRIHIHLHHTVLLGNGRSIAISRSDGKCRRRTLIPVPLSLPSSVGACESAAAGVMSDVEVSSVREISPGSRRSTRKTASSALPYTTIAPL